MITAAYSQALWGMQQNQRTFAGHAERVSRLGTPAGREVDLAVEMTGLLVSRRGYEANLTVSRAADEMVGTLLDVLA